DSVGSVDERDAEGNHRRQAADDDAEHEHADRGRPEPLLDDVEGNCRSQIGEPAVDPRVIHQRRTGWLRLGTARPGRSRHGLALESVFVYYVTYEGHSSPRPQQFACATTPTLMATSPDSGSSVSHGDALSQVDRFGQ